MFEELSQYLINLMQMYPAGAFFILAFACALSATVLPFPSEALVLVYHKLSIENGGNAFLTSLFAGIGNTAGGLISYYMGLSLKKFLEKRQALRAKQLLEPSKNQLHLNINEKSNKKANFKANSKTKRKINKKSKLIQYFLQIKEKLNRSKRISIIYTRNSLKKFGVYILLLSWLPLVGDLLCFFAGYFRLPSTTSFLMMFLGKTARYLILLQIV